MDTVKRITEEVQAGEAILLCHFKLSAQMLRGGGEGEGEGEEVRIGLSAGPVSVPLEERWSRTVPQGRASLLGRGRPGGQPGCFRGTAKHLRCSGPLHTGDCKTCPALISLCGRVSACVRVSSHGSGYNTLIRRLRNRNLPGKC